MEITRLFALLAVGCAAQRATLRPTAAESALSAQLSHAVEAFTAHDAERSSQALRRAREMAKGDLDLGDAVALTEAAMAVERDDTNGALRLIAERIALPMRAHSPSVVNLHDRMIFLCELRGDRVCAQLEAEEMVSAIERNPTRLPPASRQGAYWQRAHTLRQLAETMSGANRDAAILYARRARDAFAVLAQASGHALDSIKLLDEEIAALDGDCARALAIARTLQPESLDPQDAYTTSFVFRRCGDRPSADRLRAQILATPGFDLFTAAYRKLAAKTD